jgi:hypothetical protein
LSNPLSLNFKGIYHMKIYHTDRDTTSNDLENHLVLEAQIKYALATDHTHILDVNEYLFEIVVDEDGITLSEIDVPTEGSDEVFELDPTELSTPEIIDEIIRNSLLSSEPISKEQADTMLVLAQLKHVLAAS